ncbi:MAG: hypothetical protein HFF38_10240 [Lawsonibacter sp.]|nr:hypothetical protein [Lawsonibacter sp.]
MSEKQIPIKTALMPAYYKDFHCIMGACQDTCCAHWKVEFNKKDYLAIKHAPKSPELEALLEKGMCRLREQAHHDMYAEFKTLTNHCTCQTPEGLCRLQLECGENVLPNVCRKYPRRKTYTPAALEYSLSPSCEGVLAQLWDLKEGVDFVEDPLSKEKYKIFWPKNPMEIRFFTVRALWIDALQARALPLSQRFLLLGLMNQQLMGLDWNDEAALDRVLAHWNALLQNPAPLAEDLGKMPNNTQMFLSNNVQLLFRLFTSFGSKMSGELMSSVIGDTPLENLNINHATVTINISHYNEMEKQLYELMDHSEHFLENLMVSVAFHLSLPRLDTPQEMWKSYVNLCDLYSFYRFASVCSMDKEVSRARLFHAIVRASRGLIHNEVRRTQLRDEMFKNDSATLAHMAILVGG